MFRATTAALVGVAAGTINLQIEDCGDASTHGHVAGISPSAVEQGHKTVVSGSGHLDTTAADGSFEVKVKAAGVTMQRCSGDLCSPSKCALPAGTGHVDYHGAACPLQAGDITLDFDVKVSRFVPSSLAHLDIEIESEGSAGKLLCAKIKTSPGAGETAADAEISSVLSEILETWNDGIVNATGGNVNLQIEDCGDASTHGHVAGISPSVVQTGHKTVVSGSGHLDTTVADGSFEVSVKAAGVTLQRCHGDLCGASKCALPAGTGHVDFRGAACPLQAGDITLDFDVKVSRFVPSSLAYLDIDIESEGSSGKLLCAKIKTSPGLSEEVAV